MNQDARLLLVGPEQSPAARQIREWAAGAGSAGEPKLKVRQAADGFAALEAVAQDASLEAVLVQFESFQPRSTALARALAAARPALPIYLVCPAYLEPEALRASAGKSGLDYLIAPLGPADWQAIARRIGPSVRPARSAESAAGPPAPVELDALIEQIAAPMAPMLAAAAAWASASLGGQTARIRWMSRSAKHPADRPDPAEVRSYPLTSSGGQPGGELVAPAADDEIHAAAAKAARTLSRLFGLRQRMLTFRQMAFTDHLSSLRNRRYLMYFLGHLIGRAMREHFRITLLMFDIDDFKKYNDTYGHAVGDEIIVDIARLMRQCTRPNDVVARIGGDEFAVLFWDAGPPRQPGSQHPQEAQAVADRFRAALAAHQFRSLGPQARGTLTISGGLASFPGDASDAEGLLAAAGKGLGGAKGSGKDRLYVVGRPPVDIGRASGGDH